MQILINNKYLQKLNKKIIINYILPIILIPIICLIGEYILISLFNLGNYLGTFLRGLYEIVLQNV